MSETKQHPQQAGSGEEVVKEFLTKLLRHFEQDHPDVEERELEQ